MTAWVVYWAALFLAAVYLLAFCWRGASAWKSATKTGAVALLALGGMLSGGPAGLIAALLLCSLGDLLLSLDRDRAFLAGVGAFAAGHLAFVATLLTLPQSDPGLLAGDPRRMVLLAGLAVLGAVMLRVLWHRAGALRGAVAGYVPVILAMGIAALTLPMEGGGATAGVLVAAGAGAFILSDLVLALEMFVWPAGHAIRRFSPFVIWAFYWGAVACLTAGILGASPGVG